MFITVIAVLRVKGFKITSVRFNSKESVTSILSMRNVIYVLYMDVFLEALPKHPLIFLETSLVVFDYAGTLQA